MDDALKTRGINYLYSMLKLGCCLSPYQS